MKDYQAHRAMQDKIRPKRTAQLMARLAARKRSKARFIATAETQGAFDFGEVNTAPAHAANAGADLHRRQNDRRLTMARSNEAFSKTNEEELEMQDDENNEAQLPATIGGGGDGWTDAAAELEGKMIRGQLLKFADRLWTVGAEGEEVPEGTRRLALSTAAAWVKWWDGKPVQYVVRQPAKPLPSRDTLGDTNEDEWEVGPDGKPRDPWQNTRFILFSDPTTGEMFTFSTSSWGGRAAVSDLADAVSQKRTTQPHAVPVVELRWRPMPTKFGMKSKPWLKIVGWDLGPEPEEPPPMKTIPPSAADGADKQAPQRYGR